MKWLNIKRILLAVSILCLRPLAAQAEPVDDKPVANERILLEKSVEETSNYDRRIHRYRKAWENLIPTHTKLQYAGGMGLFSVGFGWDYGRHSQWETDLLFGFIPAYTTHHVKKTMTLKQNYIPWNLPVGRRLAFEPLTTGLYFNTVFGSDFWTNEPERYPGGYYGFSTRIRTHIFLGQRLRYDVPDSSRKWMKSVTAFYELSSCDLYVVSAFTNRYLKPTDYLRLSFGLKFQIF